MLKPVALMLALVAPSAALAELRAVLVGVGDYAYLDADLRGPVNDVGLMARALMRRGLRVEDMVVLADQDADLPDGAAHAEPDRAPILAALDRAIAASGPGDTVIFYFSGHGSQAPDTDGDEGGGLDEIFLPRDARGWNGGLGEVENAIRDDDFAQRTEAAAARGVRLVAILDACHSGTGFRAIAAAKGPATRRARYIEPTALGLPVDMDDTAAAEAPPPPGEYAFLYAAQSDQRAYEYPLDGTERWHGDFTRSVVAAMDAGHATTWSELVAAATARMQRKGGQVVQTPDIEGPLSDAALPGSDGPGLGGWPVEGRRLMAGALHDLTPGSEVALFAGGSDSPVGAATLGAVRALDSDLVFDPAAPDPGRVTRAVVTKAALTADVAIALTPEAEARLGESAAAFAARTEAPLAAFGTAGAALIVPAGDEEGFALTGADGVLDPLGPGSSLRLPQDPKALAIALEGARARLALDRLAAQLAEPVKGGLSFVKTDIEVAFGLIPVATRAAGRRCARAQGREAPATGPRAAATGCDILTATLTNPTARMQDVTVLFLGHDASIEVLWPQRAASNRLEPGATKRLRFRLGHDGSDRVLDEAVLILSVPAEPGAARVVFDRLGQPGVSRDIANPGDPADYLAALTDPTSRARGFSLAPKGPGVRAHRLDLVLTSGSE